MVKNRLFALTTLVCCGCGVAVGEDEPDSLESEKVDQKTEALDTDPPFQVGVGSSGYAEIVSATTHWCFLSGVWGAFDDNWDWVDVHINNNLNWAVRAGPFQSGSAVCAGKNWFLSYFGGTQRILSGYYEHAVGRDGHDSCPVHSTAMANGQWASFLNVMKGSFRGGGEAIWIDQAPSGSAFNTFFARDCQDDNMHVYGQARDYFVGDLAFGGFGCSAIFFTNPQPSGTPVSSFSNTPYVVNDFGSGTEQSTLMANVSEAVCGLTKVSGKFSGGCEYALIEPSGSRWKLKVKSCSGRAVFAEARCFSRVQC